MADTTIPPGRPHRLGALVAALATMVLMVATEPSLAIVWDEGFTLGREARIRSWFKALANPSAFARTWEPPRPGTELVQPDDPNGLPEGKTPPKADEIDTRAKLFSPRAIAWFWPFAREEPHGHPPFYAIAGMVGDLIAPSWAPLPRARLGPMLAFGLTSGAIFGFIARRCGTWPAILASAAWALQPNLFGHGHYATVDGLLTCLWVGAMLAFARAVEPEGKSPRWLSAILFGVLCGWAADSKLTGWFLPIPFVVWTAIYRDRKGLITLLIGGLVGVIVLYTFNPCWWADPVSGLTRFFRSNLTRGKSIQIPIAFLGRVYRTPNESLPWYNTLAWTAMVTPVGFLGLAIVGLVRAGRGMVGGIKLGSSKLDQFAVLACLHWGFLTVLRAMPHTPGHDGVRLFLPAFGVLAVVSGLGAAWVVERFGRRGRTIVALAMVEGAIAVGSMMPTPLSYFSPIVGGLPGAERLGMEPTYFWDGLSGEAIDWLNEHTPASRSVRFASFPTSWIYLKQTGRLKANLWPIDPGKPAWYVLQNRPGAFSEAEQKLLARGKPVFTVEKQGVPLVLIYPLPD